MNIRLVCIYFFLQQRNVRVSTFSKRKTARQDIEFFPLDIENIRKFCDNHGVKKKE